MSQEQAGIEVFSSLAPTTNNKKKTCAPCEKAYKNIIIP